MVIGKGNKSVIGLPRDKGLRKTILEEAAERHSSWIICNHIDHSFI